MLGVLCPLFNDAKNRFRINLGGYFFALQKADDKHYGGFYEKTISRLHATFYAFLFG
jgi:hypothetical protein